jgi:hypothetical protein
MMRLTDKAIASGLLTSNVSNIEIYDRKTNTTIEVNEELTPLNMKDIIKAEGLVSREAAEKTAVSVIYTLKREFEVTYGRQAGRFLVSFDMAAA